MIIRRKPIGFSNLRKPRSLGMSLLRDSIQRMHNHTVQHVSPSDEPLSAPADFDYADFESGEDYTDEAYQNSFDDAIRSAEAPAPGQPGKPVRRTLNSAGKKPVQRQSQPSAPRRTEQPVQRAPAESPAPSGIFKRQQLNEGDTMPRDLSAILNIHRERAGAPVQPGENPPPAIVEPSTMPSFLADRAIKKAESPASVARKPAGASGTPVQRKASDATPASFDPDEPPRPRRRAQITDLTPPKKGLPFGADSDADAGESASPSGMSPIGQPVQREAIPTSSQAPAANNNDDFFAALERAAQGEPYSDPEQVSHPVDEASDNSGQTLLDLDVRSMQPTSTSDTVQRTLDDDAAVYEDTPVETAIEDAAPDNGYQAAVQAAIQRAEAPTQDHEDSPDNPSDFDPDDGGGGKGGTPPRNSPSSPTPSASSTKPGSVQASRPTNAPKNVSSNTTPNAVQPSRPADNTTADNSATSAPRQTVQRSVRAEINSEIDSVETPSAAPETPSPRPNTPAASQRIQRDFSEDMSAAENLPTGYTSAEDYQSALNAAISAAEAPSETNPPRTTPANKSTSNIQRDFVDNTNIAPLAKPVNKNIQRDFDDSVDTSIPQTKSANRNIQNIQRDFDDNTDAPDVDFNDVPDVDAAPYNEAAEYGSDYTEPHHETPRSSSGVTPASQAVQRDFDGRPEASETAMSADSYPAEAPRDDYQAGVPTGYDNAADYQAAVNAAISRAEAPSETVESSGASTPTSWTTPRNVPTNSAAQPVQRVFKNQPNREPTETFSEADESEAVKRVDDAYSVENPERSTTSTRAHSAQPSAAQPVQRDFDDSSAPEAPAGYESAEAYQSAINAAIQRAEAPTLSDSPRRSAGKTARQPGNTAQRSTVQRSTAQRTPDSQASAPSSFTRPARPMRQSLDAAGDNRGIFLTGDMMDEPPSLEDDARAVSSGQLFGESVQRDFDDSDTVEGADYESWSGDASDTVQRTPDLSAEYGDEADSEQGDSVPSSVESELLSMIGLSPDTPIARGSGQQVQRSAAPDVNNAEANLPERSGLVQRAHGTALDATSAITAPGGNESSEDKLSPEKSEQIEKVAQAVYSRLRDRLKVERERLRGRRS